MSFSFLPLAHGLGQREDLPLPEEWFIITAAVVLAVSFVGLAVLWAQPRLEGDTWRPVDNGFTRVVTAAPLRLACHVIGVFLLALAILAGFIGPKNPSDNFMSN